MRKIGEEHRLRFGGSDSGTSSIPSEVFQVNRLKLSRILVDDSLDNGTFGSGLPPAFGLSDYLSHRELANPNLATSHTPPNDTSAHETAWMPVTTPPTSFPTFCNHCRPGEVQVPEPILTAIVAEVSRQLRQTYPSMNPLTIDSSVLSIYNADGGSGGLSDKSAGDDPLLFSNAEPLFPDDAVCSQSTAAGSTTPDELEDLFLFSDVGSK